jgi:hypothetical protein
MGAGGILSSFAEAASGAVKKGLGDVASTDVGGKVLNLIGDKESELKLSPQGEAANKMLGVYKQQKALALRTLDKPHQELWEGIKNDSSLRGKFDLKTAKLNEIQSHLQQTNHPLQSQANALDKAHPDNGTKTLPELQTSNLAQARLNGIANSFGDKMQNLSPLIAELQEHPDPRMQTHGNRVLDIISNELKDTVIRDGAEVSSTKYDVRRAFEAVNKFRKAEGGEDIKLLQPGRIKTSPTYKAPDSIETVVHNFTRMVQTPLVAIPHIGNLFNIASSPMESIGKAMFSMGDKEMQDHIYASGALSATMHDILHASIEGRTGVVSKWTKSPTAGELIYKGTHAPGFNYLRLNQLMFGGAVGYHSAIHWASNAVNGNKRAIAELVEMGLDPKKIVARGGELTPEELQQGIFHYVNNRFFIDRSQDRSLLSNANVFMRSATMYHSFMSSQVAFMRRELSKMSKAGDIKGIAQFAGSIGILYPSVAPMLQSLQVLGRTGSPSAAGQDLSDRYRRLTQPQDFGEFAGEYIDLLSHIGGMGVYMNYLDAAAAHRLQSAVLGPIFSTPTTLAEDTLAGIHGSAKGSHNFSPAERDVLQDTIPILGKPLSHRLAPTPAEVKQRGGS